MELFLIILIYSMNKKSLNIISGVASVLSIFPATDYSRFVPQRNAELRMRSHWVRTGNFIQNATSRYANEQTDKKHSA